MPAPIITPSSASLDGGQVQGFASNQATAWSVTGGTLSNVTTTSATYTAPNVTGSYVLIATGTPNTLVTIEVIAVFPPIFGYKSERETHRQRVKVWEPELGSPQTRGAGGVNRYSYELHSPENGNSLDDFNLLKAFHAAHWPHKTFTFIDTVRETEGIYRFDSELKDVDESFDMITWSVAIKQVS
jgi:hypothetical protein